MLIDAHNQIGNNLEMDLFGLADRLKSPHAQRLERRRKLFSSQIEPYFVLAESACDDCLKLMRRAHAAVGEIIEIEARDKPAAVTAFKPVLTEMRSMREKMVPARLKILQMGETIKSAPLEDDQALQALFRLVRSVNGCLFVHDNPKSSRPRDLLDALELFGTEMSGQKLIGFAGGIPPLVHKTEHYWATACLQFEQLRSFCLLEYRSRDWADAEDETLLKSTLDEKRRRQRRFVAKSIIYWSLLTAGAALALFGISKSLAS